MTPVDRALAERVHITVTANAPDLTPRTWYGMPAYANVDGKVAVEHGLQAVCLLRAFLAFRTEFGGSRLHGGALLGAETVVGHRCSSGSGTNDSATLICVDGRVKAPQARTRRTRAAVVDAARDLFLERGYAATTVAAISERSDTPQATVYRLFDSKLGILRALLDVVVAGDDRPVAMVDRPQVRALFAADDPRDQLAAFAALVVGVLHRAGPVHRIVADAAKSDPEAATLLVDIARQRHDGQRRLARSLKLAGALRPGLRERDAADLIHALASPEVYGLLVLDRGWDPARHRDWLASVLADQLL
ncbi:TetR/AcrR family transcriptional regulator [Nakamurella endophytica]|nr:TetR/AcrR family transcriptional regulator [Nakamurella endophytica]